jgi:hypothetical protein
MAVLMAERVHRPLSLFGPDLGDVETETPEHAGGLGGRLTLDEAIVGAWEGLAARAVVPCPLCGGALEPRPSAHAAAHAGGRCRDCGTTLE